jgi:hypothetical protein
MTQPVLELTRHEALAKLAQRFAKEIAANTAPDIVEWAESNYYIPETTAPIKLTAHQAVFLRMANDPTLDLVNILYSTIKKSGKTAIAGVQGRYKAEFSGNKAEVYFVAHDKEQAHDRAYESAKTSIELDPTYDKSRRLHNPKWRIVERQSVHVPTGSIMRAIASDHEGAAGGNPSLTLWTELWAFKLERFRRLWDELTPVPTRKRSMRWVETYAGFEDESELLLEQYKLGTRGRRLTVRDLEPYAHPAGSDPWPFGDRDNIPMFINEDARMLTYWDTAVEPHNYARRMPWQLGRDGDAYYREQAATLRQEAFDRLHRNLWVSAVSEFIPMAWWSACRDGAYKKAAFTQDRNWPVVMAVDASVSGDCTAIIGVARVADGTPVLDSKGRATGATRHDNETFSVFCDVFVPPKNGTINYEDVKLRIKERCAEYNIVCCTYDAFQMHGMMQELQRESIVWTKQFSQAAAREIADKQLYDAIQARKHWHDGEFEDEYMQNAAAYSAGETAKVERLRIVKKAKDRPVDPVVDLSMARSECLRLLL